jgi:hypothetical protein
MRRPRRQSRCRPRRARASRPELQEGVTGRCDKVDVVDHYDQVAAIAGACRAPKRRAKLLLDLSDGLSEMGLRHAHVHAPLKSTFAVQPPSVAIAATLGISTAIAAAGAWFYTFVLFEPLPNAGFAGATMLQWLALVVYATITLLGSTLTRSALAAAGLGVAAFIVLGILSIVPAIGHYLPTGLGAPARGLALGEAGLDVIGPTMAAVGLVDGIIGVAWLAFRRQEL